MGLLDPEVGRFVSSQSNNNLRCPISDFCCCTEVPPQSSVSSVIMLEIVFWYNWPS